MNCNVSYKARLGLKPTARESMPRIYLKKKKKQKKADVKVERRTHTSFQNLSEYNDVISNPKR